MVYNKHLTMHKAHMHAGAIRQLLYGCVHVGGIIHSLNLVDYLTVYTYKPYNNVFIECVENIRIFTSAQHE